MPAGSAAGAEAPGAVPGDDESASLALALKLQEEDRGTSGAAATAAAPSSGTDDWVVVGTKKPTQEPDASSGMCDARVWGMGGGAVCVWSVSKVES